MTVRELLGTGPQTVVTALAYDNRRVSPGTLFFCVPGFTRDGHDFAADAVARGAAALVVQRPLGLGVPEVQVDDVRAAMALAAARMYGDPTAQLPVIGVTGTNGKTTTAFVIRALLEAAGIPCGMLGTVKSVIAGVERPTERTTPEAIDLQATLAAMRDGGDRACVMEVSSHALELGRVEGVRFACAVFTNLTQDHLDFHPSMEEYFLAKRRLFQELAPRARVINVDDAYGRRLVDELPDRVTYAIDAPADYRAVDVEITLGGSSFTLRAPDGQARVECPLPGRFNIANVLAAVAACSSLGVGLEVLVAALAALPRVPGRFEPVKAGQDFAVLVDYAHTPDSLDNVLRAARDLAEGRVIVVFGAGGDRDRGKRPLMGEIAGRLADIAIATSDNPRSEDPELILDEVLAGAPANVERVTDRAEAIAAALARARRGDVVIIAGKGHEQGQEFAGGRKEPFDDAAVARGLLAGRTRDDAVPEAVPRS